MARPVLARALEFLLALIIVLEEWGWRPLAELLGRLARWRPWAAVESVIIRLPPYAALVVFVLPSALLLPLKFLALFLVAKGQIVLAGLLFVAAKVVATALVARLFMLTQPALMQIGWFAWAYDTLMPWKDALVERVHASWPWRAGRVLKERVKRLLAAQARRWQPTLAALRQADARRRRAPAPPRRPAHAQAEGALGDAEVEPLVGCQCLCSPRAGAALRRGGPLPVSLKLMTSTIWSLMGPATLSRTAQSPCISSMSRA